MGHEFLILADASFPAGFNAATWCVGLRLKIVEVRLNLKRIIRWLEC